MSIGNITEKILEDAKIYAEKMIADSKEQETSILENAKKQAEDIVKAHEEKVLLDAEIIKSRKISVANLESRKIELAVKQKAVSIVFEKAIDRIASLPEKEYVDFLVKLYEEVTSPGGELCLNLKDKQSIGEKVANRINETSKDGQVILSNDTINAKGGFVLKKGNIEINATLETLIHSVKEDATAQIAEILFA